MSLTGNLPLKTSLRGLYSQSVGIPRCRHVPTCIFSSAADGITLLMWAAVRFSSPQKNTEYLSNEKQDPPAPWQLQTTKNPRSSGHQSAKAVHGNKTNYLLSIFSRYVLLPCNGIGWWWSKGLSSDGLFRETHLSSWSLLTLSYTFTIQKMHSVCSWNFTWLFYLLLLLAQTPFNYQASDSTACRRWLAQHISSSVNSSAWMASNKARAHTEINQPFLKGSSACSQMMSGSFWIALNFMVIITGLIRFNEAKWERNWKKNQEGHSRQ